MDEEDQEALEAVLDEDEDALQTADKDSLNRRRIYLTRLVGDSLLAPKKVNVRTSGWRGVIRFFLYACVATTVILTRSSIFFLGNVNRGITSLLKDSWYQHTPTRKVFDDISTVGDIREWTEKILIQRGGDSEAIKDGVSNLALLGYNRITPLPGVCLDSAAIRMTVRRIKLDTDYTKTTTQRFNKLVPSTTKALALAAGSGLQAGSEATETWAMQDGTNWYYTDAASCTAKACEDLHLGHAGAGGYVGVITVGEAGNGTKGDANVHLVADLEEAVPEGGSAAGLCLATTRVSKTIPLDDFPWHLALDKQMGSLAYDLVLYNANLQSMSMISITFNTNMAGIVVSKNIQITSMMLDTFHGWIKYAEFTYLVCTLCYFLELCYRSYKSYPRFMTDPWFYVNFMSIASSIMSLTIWYIYDPALTEFRKLDRGFEKTIAARNIMFYFQVYMWASAVAVLSIYLRILQMLSMTRVRVMLLFRTLSAAASNILLYGIYIFAVLWGFIAFAHTHFSPVSPSFITWWDTFLSCFQMFFGQAQAMDTIDDTATPLKKPFFVFFMLCFFFISVQMFNAIVNFSYNYVSEEMEPEFEREKTEKKRAEMQMRLSGKKSTLQKLRDKLASLASRGKKEDAKEKEAAKGGDKKGGANGNPAFETLDPATKEKVEAYLHKDENHRSADGCMSMTMFLFFAILYISFLYVNLRIEHNYAIKRAVNTAIYETRVPYGEPELGQEDYLQWKDINYVKDMSHWISKALPKVIFDSGAVPPDEDEIRDGLTCIRSWNCLVWGRQVKNGTKKILRMTQRRLKYATNDGKVSEEEPEEQVYSAGNLSDGTQVSQVLMPKRRSKNALDPYGAPEEHENTSIANVWDPCEVLQEGEGGFRNLGGIVCILDADEATFVSQMEGLVQNRFFGPATGTISIEFVLYNANQDMVTYVVVTFVHGPSGQIEKDMRMLSMKLFNIGFFWENSSEIILRLLPGVLYVFLVGVFMWSLYSDFSKEQQRKRLSQSHSTLSATIDFFCKDMFNVLECISIGISLVSSVLFCIWLAKEGHMSTEVANSREDGYTDFLFYFSDLGFSAELYNRLSAINILIIFVRPLKFVRENPRIARLNQTLYEAGTDISWFVIMLFWTMFGYVLFTYISFGPYLTECKSLPDTFYYSFNYILGNFDYRPLFAVNPTMAMVLMPYLIMFYCVFSNIFFAILDRFFISVEPPPFQWKHKLKPIFQRICRCIEWDEDYVMEQDPKAEKKQGPPSRRFRAHQAQQQVQEIRNNQGVDSFSADTGRKYKLLTDVCDPDMRMHDVLHWSREEARTLVEDLSLLIDKKNSMKNDEDFIKREVMENFVQMRLDDVRREMDEAERHMQYATAVHEKMAMRDQETLAKYVLLLESRIKTKMLEQHALKTEVVHLKQENIKMRYHAGEMVDEDGGFADQMIADALDAADEQSVSSESGESSASSPSLPGLEDGQVEEEVAQDVKTADPNAPGRSFGARNKQDLISTLVKFGGEDEDG